MTKRIVITSGKGGVGKTTITANLGRALADSGKRVVLVDVDFGLNNLDVVLGVENKFTYDLSDVLRGRCRIKQALFSVNGKKNLFVLPSNGMNSYSSITGQNLKAMFESLGSFFDYVLIDCPAGIDCGFHRAVSCSDGAIVVSTSSLPSLRDADKTVDILRSYCPDFIKLIINRARGDLIVNQKVIMPTDVSGILKTELLGVLPEEDAVFLSCGNKLPEKSESYKAYKVLAKNLIENKSKIFDVTQKYSGFFGSIRRGLKNSL